MNHKDAEFAQNRPKLLRIAWLKDACHASIEFLTRGLNERQHEAHDRAGHAPELDDGRLIEG
jgi:hypothetical protein